MFYTTDAPRPAITDKPNVSGANPAETAIIASSPAN